MQDRCLPGLTPHGGSVFIRRPKTRANQRQQTKGCLSTGPLITQSCTFNYYRPQKIDISKGTLNYSDDMYDLDQGCSISKDVKLTIEIRQSSI